MPKTTIGKVIRPAWGGDLESSLKLQRMLVNRARDDQWRFHGDWVTTGPYETMMGKASCGCSGSKYSTISPPLPFSDGLVNMVNSVNHGILRAMFDYPKFAELSEETWCPPELDARCQDAIAQLTAFNGCQTARALNDCHESARTIRCVRLCCEWDGIYLDADVAYDMDPYSSCWSVFFLTRDTRPRWSERGRLSKWLGACGDLLEKLITDGEVTDG